MALLLLISLLEVCTFYLMLPEQLYFEHHDNLSAIDTKTKTAEHC